MVLSVESIIDNLPSPPELMGAGIVERFVLEMLKVASEHGIDGQQG